MVFAPVSEEIREKVIGYHLAGHGRNRIDRLLSEQGVKVSHGSISNIIARYRREHEQPPQPQSIQQQQTATNPSPVVGKGVDDINNTNNTDEEVPDNCIVLKDGVLECRDSLTQSISFTNQSNP